MVSADSHPGLPIADCGLESKIRNPKSPIADPGDPVIPDCPECGGELELYQPKIDRPDDVRGRCEDCEATWRIEGDGSPALPWTPTARYGLPLAAG